MRVGYELAIFSSHIQQARVEWLFLLTTPTKYREFFPTLFVKTTDLQLVFNFEQTRQLPVWWAWYNGSYTMMAKPLRALELDFSCG